MANSVNFGLATKVFTLNDIPAKQINKFHKIQYLQLIVSDNSNNCSPHTNRFLSSTRQLYNYRPSTKRKQQNGSTNKGHTCSGTVTPSTTDLEPRRTSTTVTSPQTTEELLNRICHWFSCSRTSPHLLHDRIGGRATDQYRHATTTRFVIIFSQIIAFTHAQYTPS